MKRTVVVLLTLGALAYFMARTSRVGLPPKNFVSKIYFIPMGDFPTDQMQRLADYYNQRFGLEIPILKSIPVSVSAVDNNRGQLVAECFARNQVEKDGHEGYRDSLLRALAVRQSEKCLV